MSSLRMPCLGVVLGVLMGDWYPTPTLLTHALDHRDGAHPRVAVAADPGRARPGAGAHRARGGRALWAGGRGVDPGGGRWALAPEPREDGLQETRAAGPARGSGSRPRGRLH